MNIRRHQSTGCGKAAWAWVLVGLIGSATSVRAEADQLPEKIVFNRDIRPILSDTCFKCHGFDAAQRKADLRLDTVEGAMTPRKGNTPIVPGKPLKSDAYLRIVTDDPADLMPPPDSKMQLTDRQKALIRKWIEQGAGYESHWSLIPAARPALPPVKDNTWAANGIDRFILSKLETEGLSPSKQADKATLVRRVYLDLTGLPPTLEQQRHAMEDSSATWYESLVDRLLDSPRFGEHSAVDWLDAARYADTHGYHIDSHRDMWRWRDWVISALNQNLPFDQFTVWQLAGDLLPNATAEQVIATGFNRNHMINYEGGAIPEEYHAAYIVDRVNTLGSVWLGLTIGCAQCHDHKYDPISHKDYYSLYAFFHNIAETPLDGQKGNAVPVVESPTLVQSEAKSRLENELKGAQQRAADRASQAEPQFVEWVAKFTVQLGGQPALPSGAVAHYPLDEDEQRKVLDSTGTQPEAKITGGFKREPGKKAGAIKLEGTGYIELGHAVAFEFNEPFSYGAWVNPAATEHMVLLSKMDPEAGVRGYDLYYGGGPVFVHIIHQWDSNAIRVNTKQPLELNKWTHVFATYDGSGKAAGVKIYLNGAAVELETTHDSLTSTIKTEKPAYIGVRGPGSGFKGLIDEVWYFNRALTHEEVGRLADADPIRAILATSAEQRTPEQVNQLRQHYLATHDEPYQAFKSEVDSIAARLGEVNKGIPTTMVMKELDKPRDTFMLLRGEYDKKGEKVSAAVPAALGKLPEGAPDNRLGLAQWLTSPENPLVARVIVNRYWQHYFGVGIVKTSEDFGSQADWPVHPELLDWLATEFVRTGWDIKRMHRLIVTSAAYRQSSFVTPELHEKDPENRLLARGPRFRLSAETIRDQALFVSGLFHGPIGGPSVSPYHPTGLWEEMAFGGPFSAQKYVQSTGQDLYRRTMYTFWKRTVPPASLSTFDAPDREICSVRRLRTNTPLQALVLMNDPTYTEAGRKLAERVLRDGGADLESRLKFVFSSVLSRPASQQESAVVRAIYEQRLADYRGNESAARQLLGVGESKWDEAFDPAELAAWAAVAGVLLSLDEAISKG